MRSGLLHEHDTLDALATWLRSHPARLSMGEQCAEFERQFSDWQGRQHAILFNSGSSANLALIQALLNLDRLRVGDGVGVSALTWATNVMPIMQLGLRPIPIDVLMTTLNVHSATVKDAYQTAQRMMAVFVTNALGMTGNLAEIAAWCKAMGIVLLEDNCEALGTRLYSSAVQHSMLLINLMAGNFGLASTFSFFVAHHMSTIEGGMVCTDDDALAEMLVMVRANGWDRNLSAGQQAYWRKAHGVADEFEAKYTFYAPAYNLRPTEITGFLGLQQLKYLDENLLIRARHFTTLEQVALNNPDLVALDHSRLSFLAPFAFPVVCKTRELRNRYVARFAGAGVEIRPLIAGNITRQPFWTGDKPSLPGADMLMECGFYCGIYPDLTKADLEILKSCLGGW